MGLSRLNYLYRAVVLEHASHPHHQGAMLNADAKTTLHNPTCGDTINLAVKVDHGHISDLMFTGSGCTISQASASMMGDVLIGQSVDDAKKLIHDFSKLIMGKEISSQAQDQLKDAAILGSVAQFPTRIKCAALAWHAAQKLLEC